MDGILASDTKLIEKEKKVLESAKNKGDVVVEKAVNKIMEEGKEGEERRRRARDFGRRAKKAMEEGGSSHYNMTLLIKDNAVPSQTGTTLPSLEDFIKRAFLETLP